MTLLDEVVFAVAALQFEGVVLAKVLETFDIDFQVYSLIKANILEHKQLPTLELRIKNIKVKNLHPSRAEESLNCRVRTKGIGSFVNAEEVNPKEWIVRSPFPVDNLMTEKLEIEIWCENENLGKENSFLIRSLDLIGRKFRTSMGNESNLGPEDAINTSHQENQKNTEEKSKIFSGLNLKDSNWILNAFSTIKKTKRQVFINSKSDQNELVNQKQENDDKICHSLQHKWNDHKSFVNMQSSIPINVNDTNQTNNYEACEPNVIEKPEVKVKTQLLKTESVGALDQYALRHRRGNEDLIDIPLGTNSCNQSFRTQAELQKEDTQLTSNFIRHKDMGKYQTMASGQSLRQSWRRKSHSHLETRGQKNKKRRDDVMDFLSPAIKSITPSPEKSFLFRSNSKEKVGSVSLEVREAFLKMNCGKWSVEYKNSLQPTKKPLGNPLFVTSESISYYFELSLEESVSQYEPQVCSNIIEGLLDLLLQKDHSVENQDIDEFNDDGKFLPLGEESEAILKCMAFILTISECQFNFVTWLALTKLRSMTDQNCKNDILEQGDRTNLTIKTHSLFLYHWLTKIEECVTCYEFDTEEMNSIAESLKILVEDFSQKCFRLHSYFTPSRISNLQYTLRCIHLLSESKSLQNLMKERGVAISKDWPKQLVLSAIHDHAINWTAALSAEFPSRHQIEEESEYSVNRIFIRNFHDSIESCKQTLLCINDFLILAEKVYEPTFQKELQDSYIKVVWRIIGPRVMEALEPIWKSSQTIDSSVFPYQELRELHASLWILLLQFSKLQRFQSADSRWDILEIKFPSKFNETFSCLVCLWLDICFFKMEYSLKIELKVETLEATKESNALSSSAVELCDTFVVLQEKVAGLCLPKDTNTLNCISKKLYEKVTSILDFYQCQMCQIAVAKSTVKDAISPQISLSIYNLKKVTNEAEKLLSSLPLKESKSCVTFEPTVRKAAFLMFSQSLPRLSGRIAHVLVKHDREYSTIISNWIMTFVSSVDAVMPSATTTLQYFWDYLLYIFIEEEKKMYKIKELQYLGELAENINFFYESVLRIELFESSEKEFQKLMEKIKLRTCPTSELIQMFYHQRLKEQEENSNSDQTFIANVFFYRGEGLCLKVFMGPTVAAGESQSLKEFFKGSSINKTPEMTTSNLTDVDAKTQSSYWLLSRKRLQPAINLLTKFKMVAVEKALRSSSASSSFEFYVKVNLEPEEWFKGSQEKKTAKDNKNPPVFDSEMLFTKVRSESEGVKKGGFVVLRLKSSAAEVIGEALVLLKDVPIMSVGNRSSITHSTLYITKPTRFEDYPSLVELSKRKKDKEAFRFLHKLQSNYSCMR